jgi:hypothetical protein
MTDAPANTRWNRRLGSLLLAALGVALVHRAIGLVAAAPYGTAAHGYSDAELLAPGGDSALLFVLDQRDELVAAAGAAGLTLLAGRVLCFLAAFLLWVMAYRLATGEQGSAEQDSAKQGSRLHLAWALALSALVSLASPGLLAVFAWGLTRLARTLGDTSEQSRLAAFAIAGVACGGAWVVLDVWLELARLCLAAARLRPRAAARAASDTWKGHFLALGAARLAYVALACAVGFGALLLLRIVTGASAEERRWATFAIDLGLFGSVCLRGAWLTWASAHLPPRPAPPPTPVMFEDAAPAAEPAAPGDPSPGPDASLA